MNYPFILKFASVSNLSDARYAAGSWADFVGFCFDPSKPQYIEPGTAKEIAGWINGPMLTGEFGQQPLEWIKDFASALNLQAIEVPATYTDHGIYDLGLRVIVRVESEMQSDIMEKADLLLAADRKIYSFLKNFYLQPIILAYKENHLVAEDYDGIELEGAPEDKPGTRNHALWNDILSPYTD